MPEGDFALAPARVSIIEESLAGLTASRKTLPPKFFYDEAGCALFGAITKLPEYYPTRTEHKILRALAAELSTLLPVNPVLVEYGASDESKATILLENASFAAYVPIDIAHGALADLRARMDRSHPELAVHPIAADFISDSAPPLTLPRAVRALPCLGFFPGSTIGNFDPPAARDLLASMRRTLCKQAPNNHAPGKQAPGNQPSLLIGVDLRKSANILIPAYDDASGVTAAFNRNLLIRLNREAEANFDPGQFIHRAIWNKAQSRIEMHLESRIAQTVQVAGTSIEFRRGETIHTENSYKYTLEDFSALAAAAGWNSVKTWTDDAQLFSVHLLQ